MTLSLGIGLISLNKMIIELVPVGYDTLYMSDLEKCLTVDSEDINVVEP